MFAATVSATSLGIIVDNTVHFMTKYLRARRERGFDRPEAIRYAFRTVGAAIAANALILAITVQLLWCQGTAQNDRASPLLSSLIFKQSAPQSASLRASRFKALLTLSWNRNERSE